MKKYLCLISLTASLLLAMRAQAGELARIQPYFVYGHKDGMALTFDVIRPEKPNGVSILFLQSGGWYSIWSEPNKLLPACQPMLAKGFTVFLVRHGSAPKYTVPDAIADVRRSVRFIRLRAVELGVDPLRLGVLGGSAGGHLSLMLATTADSGDPKAEDEVLRQSDSVAAAKENHLLCELLVIEGAGHGFNAKYDEVVVPAMVGWFEKHLPGKTPQ